MKRLAAVLLVALLSPLTLTACLPDENAPGVCAHAASVKTTAEDEFYGITKSLAETYVWVRWLAATDCTREPLFWTNWDWHTYSWWYVYGPPSTNTVAGSMWQDVYDHWRNSGITAINQAQFVTDGYHYQLKSRAYVAGDGWWYWTCAHNDIGGQPVGWVTCDYNLDY